MSKRKLDITKFKVLHDNVLIKGISIEERGGVIKPASYEDKPELGEVIAVGTGKLMDSGSVAPLTVKTGDTVYFNKYSSTKFNFDGDDYYFVHEEDIVAYQ